MRGRLLILVGLILLLVVIVVVVLSSGILNTPSAPNPNVTGQPAGPTQVVNVATQIPVVQVLVSVQNLPRGYRFPDTDLLNNVVAWRPWPENAVPFDALTMVDVDEKGGLEKVLGGQVARTDIRRESPILSAILVPDLSEIANVGSDAAAVLPEGKVAVTIPIDRETSVGYAIRDGDHVDILVSMLFVDVDEIFQAITPNQITLITQNEDGSFSLATGIQGRTDVTNLGPVVISPSERQRPRLVVQRTIQDALIVRVGDFPLTGNYIGIPPSPTPVPQANTSSNSQATPIPTVITRPEIVTLGVSPQEAVVLIWLREAKIPITLALRSASDQSQTLTENVTLDYIMSQYRIDVPGKRDYSIEPAIRSIRQLVTGEEVNLNNSGN